MCDNINRALDMVKAMLSKSDAKARKQLEIDDVLFRAVGQDIKDLRKQMDIRLTTVESDMTQVKQDVAQVKEDVSSIKASQDAMDKKISAMLEKVLSSDAISDKAVGKITKNAVKRKEFWFGVAFVLFLCVAAGFGLTAIFSNPDATSKIASAVIK